MHINHLQAQLLAEMDEEFGISNLVEEEFGSLSRPRQPVRNDEKIFAITLLSQTHLIWTPHYLNQKAFFSDLVVVVLFSHFKNNPVLSKLVILNSLLSQTVCCFPRPYFTLSLISIGCLWFLFMCVLSQLLSYLSVNYVRTGRTQKLAIVMLYCIIF